MPGWWLLLRRRQQLWLWRGAGGLSPTAGQHGVDTALRPGDGEEAWEAVGGCCGCVEGVAGGGACGVVGRGRRVGAGGGRSGGLRQCCRVSSTSRGRR